MIDLKQELQDYHVISLKDIAQNEADISDNIRNSITLYNKAIESIRSGSEDIAIIELKKAVAMNPHFYEAMNLLGLCYSYIKETAKAAEVFERVVKAENNSVRAMKYLTMINTGEDGFSSRMKARKRPAPEQKNDEPVIKEAAAAGGYKIRFADALKILSGFLAGAVVIAAIFLLNPGPERAPDSPSATGDTAAKTNEELQKYKTMYEDLDANYKLLQKDKDAANKAADYYKSVIKLYDIESLAGKKQYESAADMLLLMKTVEFKDSDKQKFDSLYKTVMPAAAWIVYEDGYRLYNQRRYEDSIKKLDKVQMYAPGFERLDAVLYYMGKCSQQLNDSRSAIAYYQKLIDSYPQSTYVKNAKIKIKDLTEQP